MRKISKRNFLKLKILLPPLPEQKKIAYILTSIDKRIKAEEAKKAQVETIKKGSMQQLLTGKTRVLLTPPMIDGAYQIDFVKV